MMELSQFCSQLVQRKLEEKKALDNFGKQNYKDKPCQQHQKNVAGELCQLFWKLVFSDYSSLRVQTFCLSLSVLFFLKHLFIKNAEN